MMLGRILQLLLLGVVAVVVIYRIMRPQQRHAIHFWVSVSAYVCVAVAAAWLLWIVCSGMD